MYRRPPGERVLRVRAPPVHHEQHPDPSPGGMAGDAGADRRRVSLLVLLHLGPGGQGPAGHVREGEEPRQAARVHPGHTCGYVNKASHISIIYKLF